MDELKFVMKCLLLTMILVVLMQVKVGASSIETYSFQWLRTSSTSQYLQSVAAGGAMALRNLGETIKQGVSSTVDGYREGSHQKAVR